MLNGLYLLTPEALEMAYGKSERQRIARCVREVAAPQTPDSLRVNPGVLENVDVLLSGWGMPRADDAFFAAAPNLKAIFYAAGAVGHFLTPAVVERGVTIVSAQEMNSVPVAEYALAMIILSLKHTFRLERDMRNRKLTHNAHQAPGGFGSVVGLISYGSVARLLRRHLKQFDLHVQVYDPFMTSAQAACEEVRLVSLDELFRTSDVVSLHTPLLAETSGLITGAHLASMKVGSSFINTARGAVIRENEMLQVLADRPDIQAILDVTAIEPPPERSPIYTLPNVFLTPHIAGSMGKECRRMGRHIADELERYCRGEPLLSAILTDQMTHTSHRPEGLRVALPASTT